MFAVICAGSSSSDLTVDGEIPPKPLKKAQKSTDVKLLYTVDINIQMVLASAI